MANETKPARQWRVDYEIALEVASHEAIVRQAYKDSQNVWTWSVGLTSATGHDVTRYIEKPASLERCLAVYVWALERYADAVRETFGNTHLTKAQFAAALSFHWNTGAIRRASWVRSFKSGDIAKAKSDFMSFRKPPEIIERRKKERDLFFNGKWTNKGTITEYKVGASQRPNWGSAKRINIEKELRAAFAAGAPNAKLADAPPPALPRVPVEQLPTEVVPRTPTVVLNRKVIEGLQMQLRDLGYPGVGLIDGKIGKKTRGAILAFQIAEGLPQTSEFDAATVARMDVAEKAIPDPERASRTMDDLRRGEAQGVLQTDKVKETQKVQGALGGLSLVGSLVVGFFGDAWESTAMIREAFSDIPGWAWGVIIGAPALGAAVYSWRRANSAQLWRLDDERTGRHNGVVLPMKSAAEPKRDMVE